MEKLKVLDLFSGIGGFSVGLENTAGFETVAFCEIDPECRRVLAKHWPSVPCFQDVTTLRGSDVGTVDVICGGFPCQDISRAGGGAGLAGARSGLWFQYARLIGELRPRYVIVENVSTLLHRGLDAVLGSLAALGYDAQWHCIPASDVGAPHIRDRVWIIANSQYPDANRLGSYRTEEHHGRAELRDQQGGVAGSLGENVADADRKGQPQSYRRLIDLRGWLINSRQEGRIRWGTEPDVGRVANGVPSRTHRLKQLGNAVVPQIPELIGRAILESERLAA